MRARIYPLATLRRTALLAQSLGARNGSEAEPDGAAMFDLVSKLGCLQIDTLQMVARSHYIALWSRLGSYDQATFDELLNDGAQRRLFEYWGHAASILPLERLPYYRWQMEQYKNDPGRRSQRFLDMGDDSGRLVDEVLERVRREGPLRTSDFQSERQRGAWWDWKPAKVALEMLFDQGDLMVAAREKFQRIYDLPERIVPDWVDGRTVPREESERYFVGEGLRALGVCRPQQVAEYAYMRRGRVAPIVRSLIEEGVAIEIEGELHDGSTATLIVHRDNLELLGRADDGVARALRTTFLSPFDSLFWARGRDMDLWGFQQVLEAYKPAPKRIWGYFCLAILHKERLVGRFDPKLERKNGLLRLKGLYLEPGVEPDEELVSGVATAMRDFMEFHGASELVVEKSQPPEFAERLLKRM